MWVGFMHVYVNFVCTIDLLSVRVPRRQVVPSPRVRTQIHSQMAQSDLRDNWQKNVDIKPLTDSGWSRICI